MARWLREGPVLFDGAMGTALIAAGLPPGESPESWNVDRPDEVRAVHLRYLSAGSRIVTTNTFGSNRVKLGALGLARSVAELNRAGAGRAREAVAESGGAALVAGSVGPTGEFVAPFGRLSFAEAHAVFREQIEALAEGGVDFVVLETFSDLAEARAAALAAIDAGVPFGCTFTFDARGRSLLGATPETVAVVFGSLGARFVGANCSLGPRELAPVIRRMAPVSRVPVAAQPNAGLPRLVGGQAVYVEGPLEFGEAGKELVAAGAGIVGGCCGTTADHIRALRAVLDDCRSLSAPGAGTPRRLFLAGLERIVAVGPAELPVVIGERLNPTARKRLAEAVRAGEFGVYREEARVQAAAGAQVLDVNVGVPGVDEAGAMQQAVEAVQTAIALPLSVDSAEASALEAGLRSFAGRALLNSVSGKEDVLERLLPVAKRYGAAVLGLTLDEQGIPLKAEDRLAVARRIVAAAESAGFSRDDLLIDCLVLAAGAQQGEVAETLKAVRLVREELGVGTILGVSNVSHGLPGRPALNATFLAMALAAGLDAAIMNPLDERMWETLRAGAVLVNRDRHARAYLVAQPKDAEPAPAALLTAPSAIQGDPGEDWTAALFRAVVEGEAGQAANMVAKALAVAEPLDVVNRAVAPALAEVGRRYETGEYFLPQLMLAAEAAKASFTALKPHLARSGAGPAKGTVILATVEGDIHDIGKNIVAVMLENHGFRVVDLGRDVPPDRIATAALDERAELVGLSALMTTTMTGMTRTIAALRKASVPAKVMVGGAVVTADYAREIGADGYGPDAVAAVRLAQLLTGREAGERR